MAREALAWRKERKIINGANMHRVFLAQSYLLASRFEEGLELVSQALEMEEVSNDQLFLSELHRMKGEFLGEIGEA